MDGHLRAFGPLQGHAPRRGQRQLGAGPSAQRASAIATRPAAATQPRLAPPLLAPQAPAAARPAVALAPGGPPAAPGWGDRLKGWAIQAARLPGQAWDQLRGFFQHEAGQWANPQAPAPPSGAQGLRVATYNAYVRVSRPEAMLAELRAMDADLVALQEADPAKAKVLAQALGMHLAWQDRPGSAYGGVALLSRFPIEASRVAATPVPRTTRLGAFFQGLKEGDFRMSALDPRFVLEAQLKVGGQPVTVLATHLTLHGAASQAAEWAFLRERTAALKAQGQAVVLAGDFNAQLGPLSGQAASEGNAAQAPVAQAMRALGQGLQDAWATAAHREAKLNGQTRSEAQLRAEAQGATGAQRQALERAAAGATLGGGGRIDGLLLGGLKAERAWVDRDAKASDHKPLVVDLRWP